MLLFEGLNGPTLQDAVTSEIQRNFAEVTALIRQHNDLGEGSPLPPAEPRLGSSRFGAREGTQIDGGSAAIGACRLC